MSTDKPRFIKAFPYQESVLALPVRDLDLASSWYCKAFGMVEVERRQEPIPTVILKRDEISIGFAINGGDPTQDGAAILVSGISSMKEELEKNGVDIGNSRIDENDGKAFHVFFVVAPDGLCFYFHEPVNQV